MKKPELEDFGITQQHLDLYAKQEGEYEAECARFRKKRIICDIVAVVEFVVALGFIIAYFVVSDEAVSSVLMVAFVFFIVLGLVAIFASTYYFRKKVARKKFVDAALEGKCEPYLEKVKEFEARHPGKTVTIATKDHE
ncbi:MAG: hypothetical protein LUD47_02210 [Clostridia bacterium]|nr:hypothetical protein [Clostridia bacterium]